jgi:hypothetical protein
MGNFTKKFKLMNRHKNSDFTREQTLQHWKREFVDMLIRSGRYKIEGDEQK